MTAIQSFDKKIKRGHLIKHSNKQDICEQRMIVTMGSDQE